MVLKLSYPAGSRSGFDWWGVAGIIALIIALVALVVFRVPLAKWQPKLVGVYRDLGLPIDVRGLALEDFRLVQDEVNGAPGMVVEGEIRNLTGNIAAIPPLRLALLDLDGQELSVWSVISDPAEVAAGDRVRFRTRVPSVPETARMVVVRFGDGPTAEGSR